MKNLGKIIFILFTLQNILNAGVVASVDSNVVTVGDTVTLDLTIEGEDIDRPTLYSICDSEIVSTSSQTSIKMINMNYKKSYILSYNFVPTKSCTIKPISISIDGKKETTQAIEVTVKAASKTVSSEYELTLLSDVNEVYVGEPFEVTLLFKQKRNAQAVDSKFVAPELKGFWIKEESQPTRVQDAEYTTTKLSYTMAAQRTGLLQITPAQMRIASRANYKDLFGSWMPQVKWKTYFSNDLNISVKPLPEGVDIVGDFTLNVVVDKKSINPNEALNVTVEVKGKGNLEDIKTFKPYVDGVSVFDEKMVVSKLKLTQKMAFVADANFTIPEFSLTFFNPKTKKVQMIKTEPIAVEVKGSKANQALTIKRGENSAPVVTKQEIVVQNGVSTLWLFAAFVAGLLTTLGVMLLKPWEALQKEKSFNIKDYKTLLVKFLPFEHHSDVKKMMDILEKSIYSNESVNVDKKLLKELVKKYDIS